MERAGFREIESYTAFDLFRTYRGRKLPLLLTSMPTGSKWRTKMSKDRRLLRIACAIALLAVCALTAGPARADFFDGARQTFLIAVSHGVPPRVTPGTPP